MNLEEKLNQLAAMKKAYAIAKEAWESSASESKKQIDDLEAEITAGVGSSGAAGC